MRAVTLRALLCVLEGYMRAMRVMRVIRVLRVMRVNRVIRDNGDNSCIVRRTGNLWFI